MKQKKKKYVKEKSPMATTKKKSPKYVKCKKKFN